MKFFVQHEVLDSGLKILFVTIERMDNHGDSEEWAKYREERLEALYEEYQGINPHEDPILEGFHVLHDKTGVKRRKNIPASENLIKLLEKRHEMFYLNQAVDIYNLLSLESKLALGAHDMDRTDGDVTLRFTDGTERFQPIGMPEPIAIKPHEYSYCDSSNEVLCRLEIRQVEKTKVDEESRNVFYIVQGNAATDYALLQQTAEQLIDQTVHYCGGDAAIIEPEII